MAIKYRYIGNGDFLPGVPARDLTDDDLDALSDEQRAAVVESAIYEQTSSPSRKGSMPADPSSSTGTEEG